MAIGNHGEDFIVMQLTHNGVTVIRRVKHFASIENQWHIDSLQMTM